MTDKELQEEWLKNNKIKKVEYNDNYIIQDGLNRTKKSSLENNEYTRVVEVQNDNKTIKKKRYLDKGSFSTLSNYGGIKEEKDELIGKEIRIRTSKYETEAIVLRKMTHGFYYCSDDKKRHKSQILKQLLGD